jgi:hypothetical protein
MILPGLRCAVDVGELLGEDHRGRHAVPVHVDPHSAGAPRQRRHERPPPVVLDGVDQDALLLADGPAPILVVWEEPARSGGRHHGGEQVRERAARVDRPEGRHVRHGHHALDPVPAEAHGRTLRPANGEDGGT